MKTNKVYGGWMHECLMFYCIYYYFQEHIWQGKKKRLLRDDGGFCGCSSDEKDFVLDDLAERYVNMENNTSERTRARWVHGRTKHINNLCNSYPILSFEAAVVVVPMTKTACSTITWRFERYVNMESTHPRLHPRSHPRPQHPPVHPPVVHPRPHPRMHPRPQHPRMHQWNPHKN